MGRIVQRIIGALTVHLFAGAALVGLIYWLTSNYEDASDNYRSAMPVESVMSNLALVQSGLMKWAIYCLIFSFISALLFLVMAERDEPASENQGKRKLWLWLVMVMVLIVYLSVAWWRLLSIPDLAVAIVFGNYVQAVGVGTFLTLLAYWLGTALFVKKAMKPSAPLAVLMKGMQ